MILTFHVQEIHNLTNIVNKYNTYVHVGLGDNQDSEHTPLCPKSCGRD